MIKINNLNCFYSYTVISINGLIFGTYLLMWYSFLLLCFRVCLFSISKYIVVSSSGPGGGHWPGISVCESAGRVYFRSPRNYHFSKCFPEVLRQKRVQYWIQTRVSVRQTMADDLHDDTDSSNLIIVNAFQHQNNL